MVFFGGRGRKENANRYHLEKKSVPSFLPEDSVGCKNLTIGHAAQPCDACSEVSPTVLRAYSRVKCSRTTAT